MRKSTLYLIFEVFIVTTLIILLGLCITSCKEIQYVPVHHYDTTYLSKNKYDSLYFYDSIFVKEKGDTIYIDKTHFKTIYRNLTDTVYKYKVDTVKVPVIEEKVVVTNELKVWQKVFCWTGFISLLVGGFVLYKKFKK